MIDKQSIRQFWRGRVVLEMEPSVEDNPGHVIGFIMKNDQFLIRVEFANGDRYNVLPDELEAL
jgi:hypothetical protein